MRRDEVFSGVSGGFLAKPVTHKPQDGPQTRVGSDRFRDRGGVGFAGLSRHNADQLGRADDHLGDIATCQSAYHGFVSQRC
jgi:hypothetical protein